jgi:PAS domain S-box-containing protein
MLRHTSSNHDRRQVDPIAASADWQWASDASHRITVLSAAFETATGLSTGVLLGRSLADLPLAADSGTPPIELHDAGQSPAQPFCDLVILVARDNGKMVRLTLSGAPQTGADGRFAGYRGYGGVRVGDATTRDLEMLIAAQARSLAAKDQALADSDRRHRASSAGEARARQLVEAVSDWCWEVDAGGRFTALSATADGRCQLPEAAYLGKRLSEIEGVRFDPAAGRSTFEAFRARRPYRDFVHEHKQATGEVVVISSSGAPQYDSAGAFLGYRGVAQDITARFESERVQRERVGRYQRIFEQGTDSYWEIDLKGCTTYLSPTFENSTGVPVAELLGRRLSDVPSIKIDPESGLKTLAAMKARRPYADLLHTVTSPDGRIIHVGTSGVPMFNNAGEFIGYCGVSKDISAQVEAARARQAEARFQELYEIAADHYWESDPWQRVTYLSPTYEAKTGIPASEIIGRRLSEIPNVSIDATVGKMAVKAILAKQPYRDLVYIYTFPDGRKRWISLSGMPVHAEDGSYKGYRGVSTDITARIEAEHAAGLAKRRLEDAFSYVTQPIAVFNGENRAVAFNQAFVDLFRHPTVNTPVQQGVSFDEIVDWQRKAKFFAAGPADERITPAGLCEVFRSGEEHTYHLCDGRWMLVVYRPLPGDGRLGLWTDITAIKQAETERRALEAQLHHSQRLEALGTLAGGAAHEINNALVPAITLSKLMARSQPEGSRERRNLELIHVGATRSRDLVKQILAFSRKEDEARPKQSVDVASVLGAALRLMSATVPTSIRIVEAIEPVPRVNGDPGQLEQVVVNMITNAIQAIGDAHGAITVSLRPDGDGRHACLSIADTGCGMDDATLSRIFEPFFTTKPVGEGTGLGLSVVHGIIEAHGGRIEVKSTQGAGSCFSIILPLERDDGAAA